jgi:O-acetyl-ADP-ribose deacetylase (regulator of RNase III)
MECEEIRRTVYPNGLPTGEAVMTSAGNMQAKYVIHTVGPVYGMNDGDDADLLVKCYTNSLLLARDNGLRSVAFPSISTGAYHYPKHEAAFLSSSAIRDFVEKDASIASIKLVFFSQEDARMFVKHSIL